MPSAPMHNPSNARTPGAAAHRRVQAQAEDSRKNLKKAETKIRTISRKTLDVRSQAGPKKSFLENLKVPGSTDRSPISPRLECSQTHANPNRIEQNRTGSNAKSRDLPAMAGNPRQPVEKRPCPSPCPNGRRQPSGASTARRSPDPPRSPRRPPTLQSPRCSYPATLRGRSGCPPRSTARRDRSGLP